MRAQLFGVGLKGISPAITAQSRVNCYIAPQHEMDRAAFALVGTPGLTLFLGTLGGNPSRGMWAVNSLSTPLLFTVHSGTLYSVNNAGVTAVIGTIGTTSGNVSMVDDGTYLMLVDGIKGYWYNMVTPGALTLITDGNFTTSPKTVTWQDTYFIVNSGSTNQWQLSSNGNPAIWPAVQINFTGAAPGSIQAVMADHSILEIFGGIFAEFWQDAGTPDFPYAIIPGSAQEYGLQSAWSLCKYDNSLAGLFKNKMGEVNISRMSGFRLEQISSLELDSIINDRTVYSDTANAQAYGYMLGGHPMYVIGFPSVGKTWMYDGASKAWSELQATDGGRHWGAKFAVFQDRQLISDYRNGNIYQIAPSTYDDNGSMLPMEVTSKHIWNDDKYLVLSQLQIDVQSGVGLTTGQGADPQLMLEVSKDGGRTFAAYGWSSIGKIGDYTHRVKWWTLGRARDWVLRLRITDPVKRVLTGASVEITGGTF